MYTIDCKNSSRGYPPSARLNSILYVHNQPVDALAANAIQVIKMCQAFSSCGIDVTLAVPIGKQSQNDEEPRQIIRKRTGNYPAFSIKTFKRYNLFGRFKVLGGYFGVRKLLNESSEELLFLRNIVFVRAAMKAGRPFIYESHSALMHDDSALLNSYWGAYVLRAASSSLMRKFVTISDALGRYWLERGIPPEKLLSVHDGFDAQAFQQQMERKEARKQIGLQQAGKIVLYVGSLYADREIGNIIDTASEIKDALFLIVGGNESERQHYQNMADSRGLNNVKFWGSIEHKNVPLFLYAADILLMVWSKKVKTIGYCSPLKVFEYMAAGRAIVGHGYPTIREVLTDGENALLVDPSDPADLTRKVKLAVETMPQELGKRARALAFDRYTWEKRATTIISSL